MSKKVYISSERESYFQESTLEEQQQAGKIIDKPEIYEVIGFELILYRDKQGNLIEHPYWVYKLQRRNSREVLEVEEQNLEPVAQTEDEEYGW